ncbi:hypothetical protein [Aeromonas dhakensis]|uniref:hypothetical protein n=1 Tax=Aeromonas dhakensis TaxID=196024 RepID=UPI0012FF5098|nr:hypothetical protein [Aeromonas dhakensis]
MSKLLPNIACKNKKWRAAVLLSGWFINLKAGCMEACGGAEVAVTVSSRAT